MSYEILNERLPLAAARTSASLLYDPVHLWVRTLGLAPGRPLIVGVNGPQGAGKTTLTRELVTRLEREGVRAEAISIDDFYLTRGQQAALAASSKNKYLRQRGYPGTHDVALGKRILEGLRAGRVPLAIPRYDKSAFGGLGDRAPEAEWKLIDRPLQMIFFEGWMLGFKPVSREQVPATELREVNEALLEYSGWVSLLDAFIFLDPLEVHDVVKWRVEAEERMKKSGKSGMSRAGVEAYVRLFLPAYELYLPGLRQVPPKEKAALRIQVAQDRLPTPA